MKSPILYYLVLPALLFALPALAVDSDGDGVDDASDAFPADQCAALDTDSDGMPDTVHCFHDDFERTTLGLPWTTSGTSGGFVINSLSSGYSGTRYAKGTSQFVTTRLMLEVDYPSGKDLAFFYKCSDSLCYFSIDGVHQFTGGTNTEWLAFNTNLAAGPHELEWGAGGYGGSMSLDYVTIGEVTALLEDVDDDNDGTPDSEDELPLDPAEHTDTDGDGIGNIADTDDDSDAIADGADNCPVNSNASQVDTDSDGPGDACDNDDDNDGFTDVTDKFPLQVAAAMDADNDGYPESWNAGCDSACQLASGLMLDNCPSTSNFTQANFDVDGQGDACDSDDDNDGSADIVDSFPFDAGRSQGNAGILYTLQGDVTGDNFGASVGAAGDVNHDGYPDVIAGAPGNDYNGSNAGSVRITNGRNGSVIYTRYGDNADDKFGSAVAAAGDVNSDGYADVIAGAPYDDNNGNNSGSARVFSGMDGSTLYTFNGDTAYDYFGDAVSGAGDVNGDGYADLVVGAYGGSLAKIFSGVDGGVLYAFPGNMAGDHFGDSVSGAGDVNGDGYADVIVGAPYDDNNGINSGSAQVFSGKDGSVLYIFNGSVFDAYYGNEVAGPGDINNDGYTDLLVGGKIVADANQRLGTVQLLSGSDGSVLHEFQGDNANDGFAAFSISGAGDVDDDGYIDLIVGANLDDNNGSNSGSARVFSGLDGNILYTFNGDSGNDHAGYSVGGAGDVNGDGYADLVVGAWQNDNNGVDSGSVRVFNGKALWLDTDSDGLPDANDTDGDGDGVQDINDAFPLDTDNDGTGNHADWDDDNDGVPDTIDAAPLDTGDTSEIILPIDGTYKGGMLRSQLLGE